MISQTIKQYLQEPDPYETSSNFLEAALSDPTRQSTQYGTQTRSSQTRSCQRNSLDFATIINRKPVLTFIPHQRNDSAADIRWRVITASDRSSDRRLNDRWIIQSIHRSINRSIKRPTDSSDPSANQQRKLIYVIFGCSHRYRA